MICLKAKQVFLKTDHFEVSDSMSQNYTGCLKFGQDVAGSQDTLSSKQSIASSSLFIFQEIYAQTLSIYNL